VGKEKKAVNTELINNTIAYSMMSVWAIIGSFFLVYFTLIFAGIVIGSDMIGLEKPPVFLSLVFLAISILTCYVGFKNGLELYMHWRRKWAIEAEDQRITRLIETSPELASEYVQEEVFLESQQRKMQ
jgi:hypothetical protein